MAKQRKATVATGDPTGQIRPKRLHPESWTTRLVEMEVGDTESRSARLPGETSTWKVIQEEMDKLRRSLSSIVSKARSRLPGAQWTLASGEFRSSTGDVIVTIAVTRIA